MAVVWEAYNRTQAALRIQCAYRQRAARDVYVEYVAAAWEAYNRGQAALTIQCCQRQRVAQQVHLAAWEAFERSRAALAIQCRHRQPPLQRRQQQIPLRRLLFQPFVAFGAGCWSDLRQKLRVAVAGCGETCHAQAGRGTGLGGEYGIGGSWFSCG